MARSPIHPGEILADELSELNMSASALAAALGVPANRISQILRGRRNITADTALRLACFFGTSARFWMNLQQSYELRLAEKERGSEIRRQVKPRGFATA
jgi:addiction module HigA family antidote